MTKRSGCQTEPRARSARTLSISSTHSSIGSSRLTSSCAEDEELAHANNPASSSRPEATSSSSVAAMRGRELLRPPRADDHRRDLRVAEHPRDRERRRLDAEVGGRGGEGLQTVERLLVHQVCVGVGAQRHPGARRVRLAAPVLPRQPSAGERAERREAEPLALADREDLALGLAAQQAVLVLHPAEAREAEPRARLERLLETRCRRGCSRRSRGPSRPGRPRRARAASPRSASPRRARA